MKTLGDYQELENKLEEIKTNHKEESFDPVWICVRGNGSNWREYKKMGMKKDSYYGWIFYSTSTNSNGYDLYEKIKEVCSGFNLYVSAIQL
ncbi:MAG: hypothetical protein GY891_00980 [Bacteroidetes bacterium]|nr:hypothetical protein [Bacteroidota bacterium]